MSESDPTAKRRNGTRFIGVVPAGTVLTPELIASMVERAPRQDFDLELTAEHVRTNRKLARER